MVKTYSWPYFQLIKEVYEARSIEEALQKINEEGYVMFTGYKDAEADDKCIYCLGKLDLNRMKLA